MNSQELSEILLALRKGRILFLRFSHRQFFVPNFFIAGVRRFALRSWKTVFQEKELSPLFLPDRGGEELSLMVEIARELLRYPVDQASTMASLLDTLQYWAIAFLYRIEAANGGLDLESGPSDWLKKEAHLWKDQQKIFWEEGLTPSEIEECDETGRFRLFYDLLTRSKTLRASFFAWVIRDRLSANVFIQYPHLVELIYQAELTGRIGTVGKNRLRIRHLKIDKKVLKCVTLPFEGKEVNILDQKKRVVLRGSMVKTIEEYFHLFSIKERQFVDVEFFFEGISNWNSQHLGIWNEKTKQYEVIDLDQREWWRQLPPIEILSNQEAKARFGDQIDGNRWVAVAKAARQYLNLDYSRCHAYLEVAIPRGDHYFLYVFGKFAREFPYGVVDNMRMFTRTTYATVAYPDENIYHTARQHVGYSFLLNYYEGLTFMEEIRKDILRAREKNLVFQFESDNCAHWIQTHLEELLGKKNVPNLFRVKLISSEAAGPVGLLFRVVGLFPELIQPKIFQAIHYPLGAWRGYYIIDKDGKKTFKSLAKSRFWKDNIVYLPAFLHRQKERGYLCSNLSEKELEKVALSRPYSLFFKRILGNRAEV